MKRIVRIACWLALLLAPIWGCGSEGAGPQMAVVDPPVTPVTSSKPGTIPPPPPPPPLVTPPPRVTPPPPRPEPRPAATTTAGVLCLFRAVPDAKVFVDGERVRNPGKRPGGDVTPITVKVPVGRHQVRFDCKNDRHDYQELVVDSSQGRKIVDARCNPDL